MGLLGPNGAGKTTLLKILLGLQRPTEGKYFIFEGNGITRKARERIGFLPEESYLYDFLTIRETVEFALSLYQGSAGKPERVSEVIELVGLKDREDRRIRDCSKGMARRAALAQSIVHDPDLLLLDEPTGGFDPVGIADMKGIIQHLRSEGKSILFCSHQLSEVEAVCDSVMILDRGKVRLSGKLSEIVSDNRSLEEVFIEVLRACSDE